MAATNGARLFGEMLKGYGVTHVFFVPAILLKSLAELEKTGIKRIMAHTEKAAAYMADGYARAAGRPGVCMAQQIGASNLASGLRDAFLGCSPVIALSGGTTVRERYRHSYQEVEDFSQFDCLTKLNISADNVSRFPDLLRQAFREVTSGSPQPVHLRIGGRQGQAVEGDIDAEFIVEEQFREVPAFRPMAEARHVREAVNLLLGAQRPIVVAGGGVVWSRAEAQLVSFAERLQIPIATSINAKGTISDTHQLSVGVLGTYGRTCANRAVSEADLVFFIGSHTGGQVTLSWKVPKTGAPVIQLDIDPRELGRNYPNRLGLLGDAQAVLSQMLVETGTRVVPDRSGWLARVQSLVREWHDQHQTFLESPAIPMRPERLCREITRVLPENAIVVCDTGHSGVWAAGMIHFNRHGQRLIRSAGSLGWGFPASMGVKCAAPKRTVLCFTGDGGMYYHLAELETAARYGINVVIVVNNNSALNQEIPLINAAYHDVPSERSRELWEFNGVNFADMAKVMGCKGMRVEKPDDLPEALNSAFAHNGPVVIDSVSDVNAIAERVR